jgi:hypothetical protein
MALTTLHKPLNALNTASAYRFFWRALTEALSPRMLDVGATDNLTTPLRLFFPTTFP